MAEPGGALAPIIEPTAVEPLAAPAAWTSIEIVAVVLLAAAVLLWMLDRARRRRAPVRALDRLSRAADAGRAADELAALVRRCGARPPAAWQAELQRLRFGPPQVESSAALSRLCVEARAFIGRR